jgi:predicted molibdopterin-dependent oxidoreductase YjgC
VPTSWSEAFRLIQEAFVGKSNRGALIGGCSTSNEDIFSIASLFYSKLKTNQVSFFGGLDHPANWKRTVRPTPIAEFESTPAVLVFGSDLSVEEPILYLRIRKGVLRSGSKLIVANSYETDADGFADILLRYNEGTEAALANALTKEVASKGSNIAAEITATGLAERDVRAAAEILREAGGSIVTTHSLFDRDRSGTLIDDLLNLAKAANASFDCFSLAANGTGAEIFAQALGAGNLTSTHQILKSCAGGEVDSLWVIGEELLDYPDQSLVKEALENVEFLVVQDIMETELTAYASLVLPMTAPAETDGTWTNIEGRVQKMKAALNPREESKPLWLVATELGARVGSSEMAFGPADVFRQFAATVPAFGELSYASIPESGALVAANNS